MNKKTDTENNTVSTNTNIPALPDMWPGAFGMYKYSKRAIKFITGPYVFLLVVQFVVGIALEIGLQRGHIGSAIAYLVDALFSSAIVLLLMSGVREHKFSLSKSISESMPFWLSMIALNILLFLSYVLSLLLLIVPFFFVYPRLTLARFYLVDKDMDILEAYKASWHATEGHAIKLWSMTLVNVLIGVLAITIIGIPFALYFYIMYGASFAVFYEMINKSVLKPS